MVEQVVKSRVSNRSDSKKSDSGQYIWNYHLLTNILGICIEESSPQMHEPILEDQQLQQKLYMIVDSVPFQHQR